MNTDFQRLRNGQGPLPRDIQKSENNMKYDKEYEKRYDFWGPDLDPEPKHVIN